MGKRADDKAEAKERIIIAASKLIREKGIAGLKVADVMAAAGLTHGAFYAHFESKNALIEAAFHAALDHREAWFKSAAKHPPEDRLSHLATSYLSENHRDTPEKGCAFAALAREFAQEGSPFPEIFEAELKVSLAHLTRLLETDPGQNQHQAMGLLSLCVGGMVLARAVNDPELSNELLSAAATFIQT
jgi:TetR/AcrR family transcriptional regulator, transcriptional repressor for nem operon